MAKGIIHAIARVYTSVRMMQERGQVYRQGFDSLLIAWPGLSCVIGVASQGRLSKEGVVSQVELLCSWLREVDSSGWSRELKGRVGRSWWD